MPDFTKQTTLQVNSYTLYCRNYAFYLIKSYLYSSSLSNHPFDKPNFIPLVGSGWLSGSKGTSGVRDIAYTIFQVPTFHQPPTPICHMFSYTKSRHRTNYVIHHRCPLSYNVWYQCQLLYCHTSHFPAHQFWRSFSSNKGTTSSKSVKHTCSYPDQGALVFF